MTNELTKQYDESSGHGGVIQDYTVADGTGIEKGTLLKVSDPRTAAASDGEADPCAGVAAREKIASDGRTQLAVYKKGYFQANASGAIIMGAPLISAGEVNQVKAATTADHSGAQIIGYSEETAADGEDVIIRLDL